MPGLPRGLRETVDVDFIHSPSVNGKSGEVSSLKLVRAMEGQHVVFLFQLLVTVNTLMSLP